MGNLPSVLEVPTSLTFPIKTWPYFPFITLGGQTSAAVAIAYSQTLYTITINHTAHGMPVDFNGGSIYLPQGSGTLLAGWYTNWTYVDANTYRCTSLTSATDSGTLTTNTAETMINYSYTATVKLADKVTLQMSHMRRVGALGTKTYRSYFNNILGDTISVTSGTAAGWTVTANQAIVFMSPTQYYFSTLSSAFETLVSPVFTHSIQLSVATTWAAFIPSHINYTDRS